MNAREIIHSLERNGYTLTVVDGRVCGDRQDMLPPPPESATLLDELRQHKGEVIDELMRRAFTIVNPNAGDLYTITFDGEAAMKRWATAVQSGLVHLTSKIQAGRQSGRCRISFRCAMPLEWLEDAITAACKEQYNRTLERIHRGEAWLRENEGSPEYGRAYDLFLALYEGLRLQYLAVGKPLHDPMTGYNDPILREENI